MILLSNTAEQTLAPGESLIFDEVILKTGCGECHRNRTAQVKMRANGVYAVAFSGNIGAQTTAGPVFLGFTLSGSLLPETVMMSTPAAATDRNNVAKETRVKNCCGDYDRIAVTNVGTTPVVVGANTSFIVERRS